jgi:hypothetical protein
VTVIRNGSGQVVLDLRQPRELAQANVIDAARRLMAERIPSTSTAPHSAFIALGNALFQLDCTHPSFSRILSTDGSRKCGRCGIPFPAETPTPEPEPASSSVHTVTPVDESGAIIGDAVVVKEP